MPMLDARDYHGNLIPLCCNCCVFSFVRLLDFMWLVALNIFNFHLYLGMIGWLINIFQYSFSLVWLPWLFVCLQWLTPVVIRPKALGSADCWGMMRSLFATWRLDNATIAGGLEEMGTQKMDGLLVANSAY